MPDITQEALDALNASATKATALESEKTRLEKELEDTRMEVLSPEYTKFLEDLEKKGKEPEKKDDKGGDDDLSKLTPKELIARAKDEALKEFRAEEAKKADETAKERQTRTNREIAEFAKTHPDFEDFRPTMYGLSLNQKNADMKLSELYDAAKEHLKKLHLGTTAEEKKRQEKLSNEKPGSDSESLKKLKSMSPDAIGKEALDEVKKELGPIPSA
jgi:hypothetical protein